LNKLDLAFKIAKETGSDSSHRLKQVADLALSNSDFGLAEQCLLGAEDLTGLLLLYTSSGHKIGIEKLAEMASNNGVYNIAFICYFLLQQMDKAIETLCSTNRIPEAAFLSHCYLPSQISSIVHLWRKDLKRVNKRAAESLADPMEYENLFPDIKWGLKAEEYFLRKKTPILASTYPQVPDHTTRDLISEIKELDVHGLELEQPTQVVKQEPQSPVVSSPSTPKQPPQQQQSPVISTPVKQETSTTPITFDSPKQPPQQLQQSIKFDSPKQPPQQQQPQSPVVVLKFDSPKETPKIEQKKEDSLIDFDSPKLPQQQQLNVEKKEDDFDFDTLDENNLDTNFDDFNLQEEIEKQVQEELKKESEKQNSKKD